ncbi:hypothetical protein [uncultured Ramlibacter sp.]|uniref:hypothetical protein n=1 Tax=uncultured Ramlibacter sp. TaxID=260755 RepID=UPI002631ACAA|nr:hypothetical protein [uncultured Ramlibacter sp.]
MEILSGVVTALQSSVSVQGGGNDGQVTTTHIAMFRLGARQVRLKATQPAMIHAGDQVEVAGDNRRGLFNARAYRNLSTQVEGHEGWVANTFLGALFFLGGFGSLVFEVSLFGPLFGAAGGYMLYCGTRTLQAIRALRQATPAAVA